MKNLKIGHSAEVVGYKDKDLSTLAYRKKLLSMGLTPGVKFKLNKVAPLGDPMELVLRGFNLSIRRAEAEILIIKRIHENCDCR